MFEHGQINNIKNYSVFHRTNPRGEFWEYDFYQLRHNLFYSVFFMYDWSDLLLILMYYYW